MYFAQRPQTVPDGTHGCLAGKEVVIGRRAAEAVLRGAHVFVPGGPAHPALLICRDTHAAICADSCGAVTSSSNICLKCEQTAGTRQCSQSLTATCQIWRSGICWTVQQMSCSTSCALQGSWLAVSTCTRMTWLQSPLQWKLQGLRDTLPEGLS